jgi:hypothetical protein
MSESDSAASKRGAEAKERRRSERGETKRAARKRAKALPVGSVIAKALWKGEVRKATAGLTPEERKARSGESKKQWRTRRKDFKNLARDVLRKLEEEGFDSRQIL